MRQAIVTVPAWRIREASAADRAAVHAVHTQAFPSDAEARLVEALRGRSAPQLSLVAEAEGGAVVGHILFTPVALERPSARGGALGLGPMAVRPAWQRRGVGSALVEAGLEACREAGAALVVVLGHPAFYPRFGFTPAWEAGLFYGRPGPSPAFMVCALAPGALEGCRGEVRYDPAFDAV